MTKPTTQISGQRQALYYAGMALIVLGILLFVSNFFTGPDMGRPNDPGAADFWERATQQHQDFIRGMHTSMVRALLGMGLIVLGGILMNVGARGAAGSGLVLNPEGARKDLEPWSRMAGGVAQDALSEVGVAKKLEEGLGKAAPEVKVRCPKCQALNDEKARYCSQCGTAL